MKVYIAKNGRRYIKLANGRAKFIKGKIKSRKVRKSKATTKRGYKTMAKRRYSKKVYRKKSSGMLGKLNRPITGALGVVAYESFISPLIPVQGVAKDLLELSAGYFLSKKRGILGATGQSLMVINSYQIMSGMVGDKLKGLFGGNQTSSYNYN